MPSGARSTGTAAAATRCTSGSESTSSSLEAMVASGNCSLNAAARSGCGSYTHFSVPPAPSRPWVIPPMWPWSRCIAANTNSPGSTTGFGIAAGA